jgi:hypothetical protein
MYGLAKYADDAANARVRAAVAPLEAKLNRIQEAYKLRERAKYRRTVVENLDGPGANDLIDAAIRELVDAEVQLNNVLIEVFEVPA